MSSYYVYILASKRNGTLYTGSTNDLIRRVWEHKNQVVPSFTSKYKIQMLVYYEIHDTYYDAAKREKRFKNWPRRWKINLIEQLNPNWLDLYQEIYS
ncbi:GIY-YIG nuclease family protein [Legionella sp. W05-934-2]|uniref:GIY-YIG nuclease family protein n=1 Tax=Legionella sp. W05-934-2 TaxID=1198649 RepID=UPI0034627F77